MMALLGGYWEDKAVFTQKITIKSPFLLLKFRHSLAGRNTCAERAS